MTPSPFRTIWTRSRDTVRTIITNDPELHVVALACLAGIGEALDRASMRNTGDRMSMSVIIAVACILGPLGGLLSLWIFSHLIRWTGSWIGGTASREHLKTAIAWGYVPIVFALPIWIPELLLFGSDNFTKETPRVDAHPVLWIPFIVLTLLESALGVWTLVLLCHTIAPYSNGTHKRLTW